MNYFTKEDFAKFIAEKKIYFFSCKKLGINNPHYFICLKRNNQDLLLLSCCTSQFETVRKYIEYNKLPESTLVSISNRYEDNPFNRETYINCNDVKILHVDDLKELYASQELTFQGNINDFQYKQIITGIIDSPVVEEDIKEELPNISDI